MKLGMHSWNMNNLDVEAKACLELLLRPNVLGVIPRWMVQATPEQKKALCKIGKHLECKNRGTLPEEQLLPADDEKAKLKCRRNEAIRINSYRHERHVSDLHKTLDRSASDTFKNVHLLASKIHRHVREPGLGGGNNAHIKFNSRKQLNDYFLLSQKPLDQQDFSKILNPRITKLLGELVLAHTDDQTNAKLIESLEDIEHTFHQVPIYIDFKGPKPQMEQQGGQELAATFAKRRPISAPTGSRPGALAVPKQSSRPASAAHVRPQKEGHASPQLPECQGKKLPMPNKAGAVLYSFSKTDTLRFPSEVDFEVSCLPKPPPYEEPPPPPPEKELRRDQVSQVYFPGNAQRTNTTYQDAFTEKESTLFRLRPPSASSMPNLQKGNQVKQNRTLLSPRMFESLRRRPGTINGRPMPTRTEFGTVKLGGAEPHAPHQQRHMPTKFDSF